jgi:hypothetical protein
MLDQQTQNALREQKWLIAVNEAGPAGENGPLVRLWKPFADGVAVTVFIREEAGEFVVYEDVGHSAAGTNRIEAGRFSTTEAAVAELIEACQRYDRVWPAQ